MEANIEKTKMKWYLRPVWVVIAILAAGPLAIPLVWMSPAFKKWLKVVITMLVILLTIWTINASVGLYNTLKAHIQSLQNELNQ
ncbi:MAG: hypothetical protein NTW09_02490 [Candidatus Omnitrophica bacterium]|nr:hypothetical protein [Candidatus Omnitrophota bacterium]